MIAHIEGQINAGNGKRPGNVPRSVGARGEAVLAARGDSHRLKRIFTLSPVPIVIVDDRRRYVDVNRAARLWYRLSPQEMRAYAMEDLAPPENLAFIEREWARLLDTGCLAGPYQGSRRDGGSVDVVYCALANILPGLHVIVFAPADWPQDELEVIEEDGRDPAAFLTRREIEVLALAADGLGGPELAHELSLSPATVNTHFKNVYAKLGVSNRAAAVAKAMRLALID